LDAKHLRGAGGADPSYLAVWHREAATVYRRALAAFLAGGLGLSRASSGMVDPVATADFRAASPKNGIE
jgi:hypothetical protein